MSKVSRRTVSVVCVSCLVACMLSVSVVAAEMAGAAASPRGTTERRDAEEGVPRDALDRANSFNFDFAAPIGFEGTAVRDAEWVSADRLTYTLLHTDGREERKTFQLSARAARDVGAGTRSPSSSDWPEAVYLAGSPGSGEVVSPSGTWSVVADGPNLVLVEQATGTRRPLTRDGTEDDAYGYPPYMFGSGHLTLRRSGIRFSPSVSWSPDGHTLFSFRADVRRVRRLPLVETVSREGGAPEVRTHFVPADFPGDTALPQAHLYFFDARSGTRTGVTLPYPYLHPSNVDPVRSGAAQWAPDGRWLYLHFSNPTARRAGLYRIDVRTGEAAILFEHDDAFSSSGTDYQLVPSSDEVLWRGFTAPDAGLALKRISTRTGEVLATLTPPSLSVNAIVGTADGWAYVSAGRLDAGDPYLNQLYRVRLRDGRLERLSRNEANHEVIAAPDMRHFVLTAHSIDGPAQSWVVDARGRIVTTLASARYEDGAVRPERVSGIGQDGVSRVWGTLYKPSTFDQAQSYPILHFVHGTAGNILSVPDHYQSDREYRAAAELGFVVLVVDGMGNVGRTREFLTWAHGRGRNEPCVGLADARLLMKDATASRAYMDLTRVGVIGQSQGGRCSTRALLAFPDDFHVAVSYAGSHDLRLIHAWDALAYIGEEREDPEGYRQQSNSALASRLKGRLLLVHGMLDDDTSPLNTIDLADALIRAGKRFDMLMVPNGTHAGLFGQDRYSVHYGWDYLLRHLRGETLPAFK